MIADDVANAAVMVPEYDLINVNQQKKADLTRIQKDVEARRIKQEKMAQMKKENDEAKELEGCTFAP